MKYLFIFLLSGMTAFGQQFGNVVSQATANTEPTTLVNSDGSVTYNPGSNALYLVGWRTVTNTLSPPNGYGVGSYIVTDQGGGYAVLTPTNNYLLTSHADGIYTNSPLWTADFIFNAQLYRSLIRAYNGNGAETSAVVTPATIYKYLTNTPSFLQPPSGPTNSANMFTEAGIAPSFLQWGDTNSAAFWIHVGRLIP